MRRILTAIMVVLALAGCTSSSAPTRHPTASGPASTSSPAAAPPAVAKPVLSDLIIGPDGLGPLVLGRPVPAQPDDVAVVRYVADFCVTQSGDRANGLAPGQPGAGAWISSYGDPEAFELNTADGLQWGQIASIAVNDWRLDHRSEIGTAKGIHAGDSTAALKTAYPAATVTHNDLSDIYVVAGERGFLSFEVSPHTLDRLGYWHSEDLDRVLSITAALTPSTSIVATDAGGHCVL